MRALCIAIVLAAGAVHAGPTGDLVPPYERTTLPNGLTLLLLEHHEVPVVNFECVFRSGSMADPAGKEGLADMTFSLLRKGTKRLDAEALALELDFLGGRLDIESSHERSAVSAQFLAKDLEAGLALFAEILLQPTFPESEVQKAISLGVDAIRDLKDSPRAVVGQYADAFLFQGHAFARPTGGTETSLPAIARQDVAAFYAENVRPNGAILAVVGDFDAAALRTRLEAAFGAWEKQLGEAPAGDAPKPLKGRKVLLVDKPDATQTYFRIGNVGVAKGNPDTAALDVVNTIFGGRFTSWLNTELRIKSGLSYGASSRFVERRVPGSFWISSFTRTDDTGKALDLALQVLERLHAQGPSDDEIRSAQNYIRGQFPPEFETAGQLASALAELEFFGLDRDYVNGHTRRVDAVTRGEAQRVVAGRYPRKDMAIVLVGQAAKVKKTAAKYGALTEKSISTPGY